jgi:chromosome segregation ATPase
MNALTVIKTMPSTKAEIKSFVAKAKQEILSGNYNPLEIEIYLKAIEELIKSIRKDSDIREEVINEAEKYGKISEVFGAKIELREKGSYDYTACGSSEWERLDSELKRIKKKKDAIESELKNLGRNVESYDKETGELLSRPKKRSTTTLYITLK